MSESLNLKLPYTSGEGVTLALLTLNELNTAYALNKSFSRLLANDMFLSMYGTVDIGINSINPYISFNEYRPNSRIIVNPTTKYSNNPADKFKMILLNMIILLILMLHPIQILQKIIIKII